MKYELDIEMGDLVRSSGWGSASVNGFGFQNCVKIEEYKDGYLFRSSWLFGNGQLWLPRNELRVGELKLGSFWMQDQRVLMCGTDQVILYGTLTKFFDGVEPDDRGIA